MVDQRPVFDDQRRRRKRKGRRENQVIGKGGVIRPDRRKKPKFL